MCPGHYGTVVGSRARGRSRDARPGVSSLLPVTCYPPPCSGSARPSGSAWPSGAFPKSIGGVGEPLRHNQPSGPSEFELGRGLPQELGRASIMEESSVLRIADGQQDAARRAQRRPAPGGAPQPDRLRRPGRSSSRRLECCRKVAPLFYVCPRLRPRRGLHRRSGGDDDAGAPAASRPPLGGRICSWWRSTARAEEPSPEATRVTCSCRIRCWALWLCK